MKECKACCAPIPSKPVIEGKQRNFGNRKYCLTCSPFGQHNTRNPINKHQDRKCKCGTSISRRRTLCATCFAKRYREKRKRLGVELLGGKCMMCGYSKCLAALTFHHRDPSKKEFQISGAMMRLEKFLEEVKKCDLLCANCHIEHHYVAGETGLEPVRLG